MKTILFLILTIFLVGCKSSITPVLTVVILSNQFYTLTFSQDKNIISTEFWDTEYLKEIRINYLSSGVYNLTISAGKIKKDTTFNYPEITSLSIEMP